MDVARLKLEVEKVFAQNEIAIDDSTKLDKVIELVKDRCVLLNDFVQQAGYFFQTPINLSLIHI